MKSRKVVFEIHRLKNEGFSTRKIASRLGIGRNTVVRYLKNPDKSMHPRQRRSKLDPFKPLIKECLQEDPDVNAMVILRKIAAEGYTGEVTILRAFLRTIRGKRTVREPFIRFESPPGHQFQIDWAHFDPIIYSETKRKLYALVVIESFSRKLYVEFTHSQKQEVLHGCLVNAFHYFGGTPKTLLVDNMITAVTCREGPLIRFNDRFLDFLRPYCIVPEACNKAAPYEKGKVENAIKYLRGNFMPLRSFVDLTDVQTQVLDWLDQVANLRVHETTGKQPLERFKEVNLRALPQMIPLPRECHLLPVYKDFSVKFDTNSYSTPPWAIGKKLILQADQHTVWIYHKEKQICSYPRCWERKKRIENPAHLEQVKKLRRRQWETREIAHFAALGEEFREYLEKLPVAHLPLKKQVTTLLSLKDQYGVQSLSWAILKALKYKAYGADYIENILNQEMIPVSNHPPVKLKNEALNRIRLSEPALNDYDAFALKRRKQS